MPHLLYLIGGAQTSEGEAVKYASWLLGEQQLVLNVDRDLITFLDAGQILFQDRLTASESALLSVLFAYFPEYAPDSILHAVLVSPEPKKYALRLCEVGHSFEAPSMLVSPSLARSFSPLRKKLVKAGIGIKRVMGTGYLLSSTVSQTSVVQEEAGQQNVYVPPVSGENKPIFDSD